MATILLKILLLISLVTSFIQVDAAAESGNIAMEIKWAFIGILTLIAMHDLAMHDLPKPKKD